MSFATRCLLIPAVAGLLAGAAPGADDTAPRTLAEFKRLVDTPTERVSVLDNGLTVILKTHRTAPMASVRMYCRTGSIYEQEYLGCGLSHLFEHLLHGGETATRTEEESRKILEAIGGNSNAYTSYDVTCYYINTGKEHTAAAVELLGDWITNPTWPQEAFDREWAVVQRELERDVDNPSRQLFRLTTETMYLEHPVRFPIIGYQPAVQSLTREDIIGYYERMYVPDNIIVCIVGDIDLDAALATVAEEFVDFTRKRLPTIVLPREPEMTTPRQAVKRMNVQAAILQMAWPSIHLTHKDLYALDLLSYVLTQGESSRLTVNVRDRGLTYGTDSMSWTPEWARGIFTITSRLDPTKIADAKAAIMEQIGILQRESISDEELAQAKRQKAAEHVFASQTAESVASMIARDYISTGDIHFSEAYVDNIQTVTAEQVREMARKYLVPDRLGTILLLPTGAPAVTGDEQASGEPDPVRMITLDNGLRCLIRRDPTTPLVAMQAFSLGGVSFEDESTNGLSQLAAMLASRGTATRDAQQIARFFDARGGSIGGAAGNNTIYFQAEVLSEDFAEALEVFAEVVCEPTFPESELEIFRPRLLDAIKRTDEHWRSELFAFFKDRFFVDSPYRFLRLGSEDVVAGATREDVERFYRQQVSAGQTVVAIYGDMDSDEAERLLREYFGKLAKGPASLMQEEEAKPGIRSPQLFIKAKGPDRQAAGICIGFPGLRVTDTDDMVPLTVLDTIISGYRLPTGWMHEALRGGDRSLVYEVHAVNQPGIWPGSFHAYAACQPEKVSEVYTILTEQFDRARKGDFTEDELARAKTIITTAELMEHQTNSECAMQACLDELYGLGYDYRDDYADRIRAVTLDDVKRMATKYLTIPTVAVVTPAPEAVDIGIEPIVTPLPADKPTSEGAPQP